jgi:hypothetical protein
MVKVRGAGVRECGSAGVRCKIPKACPWEYQASWPKNGS